jgi:hypothetical protein
MAETEIGKIREILASSPHPPDLAGRRKRLDEVFGSFPLSDGAYPELTNADGVPAEWTSTSSADCFGGQLRGQLTRGNQQEKMSS